YKVAKSSAYDEKMWRFPLRRGKESGEIPGPTGCGAVDFVRGLRKSGSKPHEHAHVDKKIDSLAYERGSPSSG
ncbi:MAG: hypothetical protein WAU67_05315, partial [Terracidiphilus sp.]